MIKIDKFRMADIDKVLSWNEGGTSDDLLKWAGSRFKHPLDRNQIEQFLENEVCKGERNIFIYKIILEDSNDIIGTMQLKIVDKENKVGWISRVLIGEENDRGKGYGRIAVEQLLEFAFEKLNLKTIGLGVFDFNYPAIKCYEKVGFNKVKFIDNARKYSRGYWNLYEMYITKMQWNFKKQRLETMKRCEDHY